MPRKSFVTTMPDKAGAFLLASKLIAQNGGNIVRVSYNKAIDLHMLFIDVVATGENLCKIENGLLEIGYINEKITEIRVIEVTIKIPDRPGAVLPVLEIINRYDVNISYLNSSAGDEPYQNFKIGMLIENPKIIKNLLDEISELYQINIIECDDSEENLDNTVFYIRLGNEMQQLLNLSAQNTMAFISESNRMLQVLQAEGEDAGRVFDYIRRFAYFVSGNRGEHYKADIEKLQISEEVTLYSIQPLCGSNTYVLEAPDELVLIDTGYAIYAEEMNRVFNSFFPDFATRKKRIYITHADVDHCGLLAKIPNAQILLNQKSAESLQRQVLGLPDFRENTELRLGYSKVSRIISGYLPPNMEKITVFDSGTPAEHSDLMPIGTMMVGGLDFTIYEGSGGHVSGEMIYACERAGVVFTGDILVNINDFSKERAEFNSLAPYLMKSVNVDSKKATAMRKQTGALIVDISRKNGKPCVVCGGHGPVSELSGEKLIKIRK